MKSGKVWKVSIVDVALVLLLLGAVYVSLNKETYFEVKGNDILGASATFHTLMEKGYCVDATVRGYTPAGEMELVSGRIVDGTRSKLYVYDGNRVWVLGSEEVALTSRVFDEEMIPADLIPLTITLKTAQCRWRVDEFEAGHLTEISGDGIISFYGFADAEDMSAAEALWLSRRVSAKTSGDVYVGKNDDVLTVYAANILPEDFRVIYDELGDIFVSNINIKTYS